MSRPALNLRLVSAPPPKRSCNFCGEPLTAIELWHGCPQRRLAFALYGLRQWRLSASPSPS